jgi:glucose/arabinose dehydrogenase
MLRKPALPVCLLFLWLRAHAGTPVDLANFEETVYVTGSAINQATSMAWAPDGRLFILRQHGEIKTVRNGAVVATFASFGVRDDSGYAGALGICVDRNYASNKHVYVLATVGLNDTRILRWTASGDTGGGMTTILGGLPTRCIQHDGGGLEMGPDGKLYFGMGDLGTGAGVDGDLSSLASKVGRCNPDGSAPSDNPYYDAADGITQKDYIWARGFRNAFALTFQPSTGKPWVSDVGERHEQIFLLNRGDHGGWNDYEGGSQPAGYVKPKVSYPTNGTTGTFSGGGCVGGATFYTGSSFPSAYQGNLFWGDYNSNKVYRTLLDGSNNVLGTEVFVSGVSGFVDISVGPDGALYYVDYKGSGNGTVYRLQSRTVAAQDITVSTTTMTLPEGGSGTFTVRLAQQPSASVTVGVGRSSGDPDVSPSPTSLTFTPTDWSSPKTVTVSAAHDADTTNDSATITCSSSGLTPKAVSVTVTDDDTPNGSPTARITKPADGETVTGTAAEWYGDGTDDAGCVKAEFLVDGVLKYTDVNSTNHYHYGGGHNRWDTTALPNGTHRLRMVVHDGQGLTGSHEITVTVDNPAGGTQQEVTGFTLINADTDQPVPGFDPILSGALLNLGTLPTRNLNLRADTSPSTVGSVRFDADGALSTQNGAPYALAGDTAGDYFPWTPPVGAHSVTATPYTLADAGGAAGMPATVTFSVIDDPTTPSTNGGGGAVPPASSGSGGGGGCGATGAEALALLLALAFGRRRR